jgi:hypothetical protein
MQQSMRCPTCKAEVPASAAICAHCDHILDPASFDAEARPPAAPKASGPRAGQGAGNTSNRAARPAKAKRLPPSQPVAPQSKGDWRAALSKEDWEQDELGSTKPPPEPVLRPMDVDATLRDWRDFIFAMGTADKIAFFGIIGMLLACFFPWRETVREGEVLGVASRGFLVFLLAAVAQASIVVRVRKLFPKRPVIMLWAVQLGAIGVAELVSLILLVTSFNSKLVVARFGNEMVWASKPSFGVILAIAAGAVAAFGTVIGLKDVRS